MSAQRSALRSWPARVGLVAALAVGAGMLTLVPGITPGASAAGLVPWEDCDALLEHYRGELERTVSPFGVGGGWDMYAAGGGAVMEDSAGAPMAASAAAEGAARSSGAVGTGPTGTNLQEAGVDEPDTAKLANGLVVASAGGRLQVVRGGAQPALVGSVELGEGVGGGELLVDGARVLVIGTSWYGVPEPAPLPVEPGPATEPAPLPPTDPTAEPLPVEPDRPVETAVPVEPSAPTSDATAPADEPADDVVTDEAAPPPDSAVVSEATAPAPDAATSGIAAPDAAGRLAIAPAPGLEKVRLVLVDVADPAAPRVVETLEIDGRYVSARLVDGTVRLVTSSTPRVQGTPPAEPYGPEQESAALEANRAAVRKAGVAEVLPRATRFGADGAELSSAPAVQCAAVQHAASGVNGSSTLLVTTLRPADGLAAVDATAVTTDGDLVYASPDRLYVATSRWGTVAPMGGDVAVRQSDDVTTELHAFDTTSPRSTRYVGSGRVKGYLYGRWALSEHEGVLRVATTLAPPWGGDETTSSSLVTLVEDGDALVERGRVDGLGKTERIFAVRYFGDVATVVTFRQTDPLYVLDLSDPAQPRVTGELKIPGFSTYLHPVGDDRLLGVGQDATEDGRITGFQISLFDISDRTNPVQLDRLSLGEGYSVASDDSRAFGYDPERGLAVLPFATWDPRTGIDNPTALAVRVDGDRLVEAGRLQGESGQSIDRVLLDGDRAYAVSWTGVTAADLPAMTATGSARFAGVEPVREVPIGKGDVIDIQPVPPSAPGGSDGSGSSGSAGSGAADSGSGSGSTGSVGSSQPGSPGTG